MERYDLAVLPYATQAEAEGGSNNTKVMTPLRTKQFGDNNYLSLSGGTMEGGISFGVAEPLKRNRDDSSLVIAGGASSINSSYLQLYGGEANVNAGGFILCAFDNNGNKSSLNGLPDGTLTWESGNVLTDSVAIDYIVESYRNGTEWYRVWESGWVEQGGSWDKVSNNKITFLKPFADTNYSVFPTYQATSVSGFEWNKTTTNATKNGSAYPKDWYACGQGA